MRRTHFRNYIIKVARYMLKLVLDRSHLVLLCININHPRCDYIDQEGKTWEGWQKANELKTKLAAAKRIWDTDANAILAFRNPHLSMLP
jgi:hypothetical protein